MSDFRTVPDFIAGFAARHEVAAGLLQAAFSPPPGFQAVDPLKCREPEAGGGAGGPRHFHPADRTSNPTAGWNPLDPAAPSTAQIDPLEAAHTAGFAEGFAAATAQMDGDRGRDDALLAGIGGAIGGHVDRESIAAQLRQTVLLLVTRVVGEVGVAADRLAQRVEVAAGMLADTAESAMLRVHPDDVALLDGRLPTTIFPVGDASVARGSFVLESASTVVEDGPALWLEQLTAAIDRVPLPKQELPC